MAINKEVDAKINMQTRYDIDLKFKSGRACR